jgi:hypothetical protein
MQLPRKDAMDQQPFRLGEGNNLGESDLWSFKVSGAKVINLQEDLYNRSGQHTIKRYNSDPVIA